MIAKRSVTMAAGISAAFLATSTAFAVSNGIFGNRRAERVGTFRPIEARLAPANSIVGGTPPRGARTSPLPTQEFDQETVTTHTALAQPNPVTAATAARVAPPSALAPTTHSTASTIPTGDHHEDHGATDDGLEADD